MYIEKKRWTFYLVQWFLAIIRFYQQSREGKVIYAFVSIWIISTSWTHYTYQERQVPGRWGLPYIEIKGKAHNKESSLLMYATGCTYAEMKK